MADKKISQLTVSTIPLAGTEVLPIVQSGETKKISVNDLMANNEISSANLFSMDYLVVGGGGGGAIRAGSGTPGAGGSGGGVFECLKAAVAKNKFYGLSVGAGGPPTASISAPSAGTQSTFGALVSFGAMRSVGSGDGGDSGFASNFFENLTAQFTGGTFAGAAAKTAAGGGAGAGENGDNGVAATNGGDGGDGIESSVSGAATYYGGGGGGGGRLLVLTAGVGGLGGGGTGDTEATPGTLTSGGVNTGGGGGGKGVPGGSGTTGGSGVIIFNLPSAVTASFSVGVTATLDDTTVVGQNIYTVTAGTGTVIFN